METPARSTPFEALEQEPSQSSLGSSHVNATNPPSAGINQPPFVAYATDPDLSSSLDAREPRNNDKSVPTATNHDTLSSRIPNPLNDVLDPNSYRQMEEDSEKLTAWAIHIVLGIFCGLVILSVVMTFFVIEAYGFVAMIALTIVLVFTIFLLWFVDKTVLSKDAKLKPIRQKIIRVVETAKQAVIEEFHLFQQDWNDHYLLTYELSGAGDAENKEDNNKDENGRPIKSKKRRGVIFKMVKPALRFGHQVFRGKRKGRERNDAKPSQHGEYSTQDGVLA